MLTTYANTSLCFVGKMRESIALQKIFTFFQQKNNSIFEIFVLNFNETLINVVDFEQPGPVCYHV